MRPDSLGNRSGAAPARFDIDQLGLPQSTISASVASHEPATAPLTISIQLEQWMIANFRALYDPLAQRSASMIGDAQNWPVPGRRAAAACLASCLPTLLCGSVARAQSVAFINPGKSDEIYWVTATQGMQAAAHSLGMTFEVQYAEREPLKTFAIAREMVARAAGKRPEYIVITDDSAVADQLLKIIDAAGVKSFLAYSSIPIDQRVGIGSPRSKYKGWLGSLEPRAEDAGYLTAHALIERGKKEEAFGARWQASHARDCRRSLHILVDQAQ